MKTDPSVQNPSGVTKGIRQIKHLASNPGSRVGSHKAATRIGDQSSIHKKGANDQRANPEKFAGSIFRPAPKIGGVGIPAVSKEGSGKRQFMNHAGSSSHVHPTHMDSGSGGSLGFIRAPKPLAGSKRPKNGSCNAVVRRHDKG